MVIGARYEVEVIPAIQERDWRQRWDQIQHSLGTLLALRTEQISKETIQTARHQLQSFYVQAYSLKDALKEAALKEPVFVSLGVKPEDIETIVGKDASLALLADLANLDKHEVLRRSPRSGVVPTIGKVSAVSDSVSAAGSGWRLSLTIKHGSRSLDGLAVARDAISAWRRALTALGLL